MKIFISSGHPDSEAYKDAMNQLKTKLFEMCFDVTEDEKDLPHVDCAYFMDGWFENERCRMHYAVCHLFGVYKLFQTAKKSFKEYFKTLDLQLACLTGLDYTLTDIRGESRKKDIVTARFLFAWYCRVHLKMRWVDIAEYMNRTHATIIHYVRCAKDLLEVRNDIDFLFDYTSMMRNLVDIYAKRKGCMKVREIGFNKVGVWFKPDDESNPNRFICRPGGEIRLATNYDIQLMEDDPLKQSFYQTIWDIR